MKNLRFTRWQVIAHLGALSPLAWLAWDALHGNLTVNPVQALTLRTGKSALVLLVLSLACTPLNTIFGLRSLLKIRRALGLYAFMYASLHFFIFIGLDYTFDWSLLQGAIFEKPFALVGLAAFIILLSLASTSFKWWQKRLGKNWKRLHRLIYLASGLAIVHFAWSKKGDVLALQGDIVQPIAFGFIVALLLLARVPAIRKWLSQSIPRLHPAQRRNAAKVTPIRTDRQVISTKLEES